MGNKGSRAVTASKRGKAKLVRSRNQALYPVTGSTLALREAYVATLPSASSIVWPSALSAMSGVWKYCTVGSLP